MLKEAGLFLVTQGPGAVDRLLGPGEIQFGGVLRQQDHGMLGDAGQGGLAMGTEDLLSGNTGVGEEAIGAVGLVPATAGAGDAGGGLGGKAVQDDLLPLVEPVVAQVQRLQFFINPTRHASGPRAGPGPGDGPPWGRRRNPFPDKIITSGKAHRVAPIGKRETIANYTCVPSSLETLGLHPKGFFLLAAIEQTPFPAELARYSFARETLMMTAKQTVIVTGGNTGLGFEAARAIAESNQGWHVVIACRNPAKAAKAVQEITNGPAKGGAEAMSLDLSSLASVRAFAQAYSGRNLPPLARRRAQRR